MNEGDVARRDARLDQQTLVQRHDLHELAVGRHHTADGGDLDILDDAPYRRTQGQARDGIGAALEHGGEGFDIGVGLGQFLAGTHHVVGARLGKLEFEFRALPIQAQDFHAAGRPGPGKVIGDLQLAAHQTQRLVDAGQGIVQATTAGVVQLGFSLEQCRVGIELGREFQRLETDLGLQPGDAGQRGPVFGCAFAEVGFGLGRIQLGQHLPALHDRPFGHIHFGDDPAFERLDDLLPRTGNHLAGAGGDFHHFEKEGPDEERQEHGDRYPHHAGGAHHGGVVDTVLIIRLAGRTVFAEQRNALEFTGAQHLESLACVHLPCPP